MRISDWSSDVCSSDLQGLVVLVPALGADRHPDHDVPTARAGHVATRAGPAVLRLEVLLAAEVDQGVQRVDTLDDHVAAAATDTARSAEHTSELQSLMPISYAATCLKKTKTPHTPRP